MESVLDIFNPKTTRSGDTITVTYCHNNHSGTCVYNETVLKGPKLKQKVCILTNTDMGDVLEYLYKIGEITGPENLKDISYEIQRHSRFQVESFIVKIDEEQNQ
jgi:hypothetical protein